MKKQKLIVVSLLLVAAGCAHHEKEHFSQTYYSPAYSSGGATDSANNSGAGASTNQARANYQGSTSSSFSSSDQALSTQLQQSLSKDPTLAAIAPQIQVTVQGGAVTLNGTVPSEQEKQAIETTAKSTTGVVNVNNQLQVATQPTSDRSDLNNRLYRESKTDNSATDAALTQAARSSALSGDNALPQTAQSSTETTNRLDTAAVTATSTNAASGQVPDLTPTSQRTDATSRIYSTNETAAATAGDTFSANVQGSTDADRSIGRQVIQELRTDTSLAATLPMIKISADNGKITLTGTVKNDDEKKKIETAVQRVAGVSTVENQLQVSTNPAATDSIK